MNTLNLSFELLGYGLAGVFLILILVFGIITALVRIFPVKEKAKK